jgi:hypothetical protein
MLELRIMENVQKNPKYKKMDNPEIIPASLIFLSQNVR